MPVPAEQDVQNKVAEILGQTVDLEKELNPDSALMADLGLDSLDLIEFSFALEEFFEFPFSDKNPIESLDMELGEGLILDEQGHLTDLGMEMVFRRMPELKAMALPEALTPHALEQYYALTTFVRLIMEFYQALPEVDAESGERVVLKDLKPVTEESGTAVTPPEGDVLVSAWVEKTAAEIRARV